jgi:type II secretory pathway component GspD/PulD (secretin)
MGQVTVIASPENMRRIEKQIKEWDVPLDVDAVKPRIIELQNSDPVQMSRLLTRLFTEDQDSSANLIRMILYGRGGDQRKRIIGPLYGQLTFEDVPGTKKIIVISKIPQAYDVIEQLIYELDRQEMAEIPRVVQLQYADPEDLSERLNAMFNEPGTTARIRRTPQGLREYSMDDRTQGQGQTGGRAQGDEGASPNEYTPWWSAGARRNVDEEPLSNVIGRVRFVPDPRSKSILVLAPPQFQADIERTIRQLDTPGKQVMIKAIIVEVDHRDLTSLGIQLSSNPAEVFGNIGENAVTALASLNLLQERGSGTIAAGTDITALVDFLVKTVNAKILNQQALWTQDNEEATLFKGDRVAFQTNFSVSEQGGRVTTNFEFQDVGMRLAVRPSITPEKDVDMVLTVLLSQLTGDIVNGQPTRRVMETTTNMIIEDGQTLMLGGILFQTDSTTERKVPLLGDLPLMGPLFRHYDVSKVNNEMIVFITPFVIDDARALSADAGAQIEAPREKLRGIRRDLDETTDRLRQKVEKK